MRSSSKYMRSLRNNSSVNTLQKKRSCGHGIASGNCTISTKSLTNHLDASNDHSSAIVINSQRRAFFSQTRNLFHQTSTELNGSTNGGNGSSSSSSIDNGSSGNTSNYCVLCDEHFPDFSQHSLKVSHQARHAICKAYVVPERHEAIMSQLWDHIRLDFALVDQVHNKKLDRRRMKLSGTIGYLVEQGVLMDSVPTVVVSSPPTSSPTSSSSSPSSPSSVTSSPDTTTLINKVTNAESAAAPQQPQYDVSLRFPILLSVGESYLLYEATQRLSRLMPKALAREVQIIAEFLTHPRQLRALFELLQMETIIANGGASTSSSPSSAPPSPSSPSSSSGGDGSSGVPKPRLGAEEKVAVLLAMLGELRLYASRDRKHTVTDKIVADELVLNVLANHCCENLVSELVHTTLQRIVDEGTPVWNEHCMGVHRHLFASGAAGAGRAGAKHAVPLADMPTPHPTQGEVSALFAAVTAEGLGAMFTTAGRFSSADSALPLCEDPLTSEALLKGSEQYAALKNLPVAHLNWSDTIKSSYYDPVPRGASSAASSTVLVGGRLAQLAMLVPKLVQWSR